MKKLRVAVQLYSVRDVLEKDFFGTLKAVKDMGYEGVEFAGYYGNSAPSIKAALDELGLVAVSSHTPLDAFLQDLAGIIAFHKTLGCEYIAVPWLDEKRRPGTDQWPSVTKSILEIATALKKEGMKLLYHNHDFEFLKIKDEYALDLLYKTIGPELLETELDTCWVKFAGEDPAAYIRKYSGRAPIVHLKDFVASPGAKGKSVYALIDNEGKDQKVKAFDRSTFDFKPLGMGIQDMPAILKAAESALSKWAVVEQDASTERPSMDAIRLSREYLRKLGY
jgi:Sugar phosphate isomerases/epimerases